MKNNKKKIKKGKSNFVSDSYFAQGKQYSHFVQIPTLRRDNSGVEPCQVGILTSSDKVRIPSLRMTSLELSRFLLCADIYLPDPALRKLFTCSTPHTSNIFSSPNSGQLERCLFTKYK